AAYGQQVAFGLQTPAGLDMYVVPIGGGEPRRLTAGGIRLSWSHDGRWIYFAPQGSARAGQIWKIPLEGGEAVQVIKGGGFNEVESPDGKTLFFDKFANHRRSVWSVPVSPASRSSVETPVLSSVGRWAVTEKGIFFTAPHV